MKTIAGFSVLLLIGAGAAGCADVGPSGPYEDDREVAFASAPLREGVSVTYVSGGRIEGELERVGSYLVFEPERGDPVRLYSPRPDLVYVDAATIEGCHAWPTNCAGASCVSGDGSCSSGATWAQCDSLGGATIICTCQDKCTYLPALD